MTTKSDKLELGFLKERNSPGECAKRSSRGSPDDDRCPRRLDDGAWPEVWGNPWSGVSLMRMNASSGC